MQLARREFIVVYDYGMGGIWGIVSARSKNAILSEFPDLIVFENRPSWMSEYELEQIRNSCKFDLDDPTSYPSWVIRK